MKRNRNLYVVYDIGENEKRSTLARRLKYYGLHRVQYSTFSGNVELTDKEALLIEIEEIVLDKGDKIHVIDLCDKCLRDAILVGKDPNAKGHLVV